MKQSEEPEDVDVHVMPSLDSVRHIESRACICSPYIEEVFDDGAKLWVHRCIEESLQ